MGKIKSTIDFLFKIKNTQACSLSKEALTSCSAKTASQLSRNVPMRLPNPSLTPRLPRFLYTFTTVDNYNSIMNDGFIKTSTDQFSKGNLSGVFMVSLENLCKRWIKGSKDWDGGSLMTALLNCIAKKGKGLVCLKISTAQLHKESMIVRSQNEYFKAKKSIGKFDLEHAKRGTNASYYRYLIQKKHAVEFIYPEQISIDLIQSARIVNPSEIHRGIPCGINAPQVANLRILNSLFEDMPESKFLAQIPEPQIIPF